MKTTGSNKHAGEILLARRSLAVIKTGDCLIQIHRPLERRFGVILSAEGEEPLLVLRLADFLRECRFKDVEPLEILEK